MAVLTYQKPHLLRLVLVNCWGKKHETHVKTNAKKQLDWTIQDIPSKIHLKWLKLPWWPQISCPLDHEPHPSRPRRFRFEIDFTRIFSRSPWRGKHIAPSTAIAPIEIVILWMVMLELHGVTTWPIRMTTLHGLEAVLTASTVLIVGNWWCQLSVHWASHLQPATLLLAGRRQVANRDRDDASLVLCICKSIVSGWINATVWSLISTFVGYMKLLMRYTTHLWLLTTNL